MPEFSIDKNEVLRYAGHKGIIPDNLDNIAQQVIRQCMETLTPRHTVRRARVTQTYNGVVLDDTLLLQGKDIKKHLDGCDECYILCATVGVGADSFIRTMQVTGSVYGLLADAAGSAAIEAYLAVHFATIVISEESVRLAISTVSFVSLFVYPANV